MALDHKAANRWVARFIPILLAGILGYVTWVITALVCGKLRDCFPSAYLS